MSYRPDIVNPYKENPITGEWKLPSVIFEEGITAAIEALKKGGYKLMGADYLPSFGNINEQYLPTGKPIGYLVFIPEEGL